MSTDVIGSRYRLGPVVTCTPEATTWDARDTWLDERVLVVTPEPGCDEQFAALAGAVLDRSSSHLVGFYDIGATTDDFVVFAVPAATLSDEQAPREEEDVLLAGLALGDALEALHERGIVHGDLHPGSVIMGGSGGAALSPWPLAPRPRNWSGPGGFGTDPDEPRYVSTRDDMRALGAVLLGALAGPPVLSSEQVANIERELAGRAPNAVTIADRALTPPGRGGYAVAAELRDDCAAVLAGRPVAGTVSDQPANAGTAEAAAAAEAEADADAGAPEGRRAALVLAASGAALFAGFGIAGSIGAGPHAPARPFTTHATGCGIRLTLPRCTGPDGVQGGVTARPLAAVPARFADHSVAVAPARASGAPATVSTATPSSRATATVGSPGSSTTTSPPSTTTSSSPSTTTTAPPATTTTAPATTTTAPASTTTSTSTDAVQAGTSSGSTSSSGLVPGGGPAQSQGTDR
jgi:serine/threonine-protein kinase